MTITPDLYSAAIKIAYFIAAVPMSMVIVSAVMSAKKVHGTLGDGLKKIAAGSIIHTIVILTYIMLENGARGSLSDATVYGFFFVGGTVGSTFLIMGYVQIYQISKKLKLFAM